MNRLSLTFFHRLTLVLAIALLLLSFFLIKGYKVHAQTDTNPSPTDQTTIDPTTDAVNNLPAVQSGPVDIFLKLDGIVGESTDKSHPNEIVVDSFDFGLHSNNLLGAGIATGKRNFQPLNINKVFDLSSPKLFQVCAAGQNINTGVISVRKQGGTHDFLTLTFNNLICSSDHVTGTTKDGVSESLSFNYSKVQVQYNPQSTTGELLEPVSTGWDLKANKAF